MGPLHNESALPFMPRAAPLANAPLAPDAAAVLEAQKRAFLRLVSHELRTPLNSILGFSEILAAELYGPLGALQYKEYAEIIRGSGKKLLKLVNQVLEIGRLQGLKLDVGPEALQPAFDEVVRGLGEDVADRGVRIRVVGDGPLPEVLADPWGLRTVLTHLLQNAIQFSPQGGEVRLRAETDGAKVNLFIEDDGEGVAPAELERLMRPFEQGQSALMRHGEGAGLGLPICDLTCRAMGARLKLTSKAGHGLTARVSLKAA